MGFCSFGSPDGASANVPDVPILSGARKKRPEILRFQDVYGKLVRNRYDVEMLQFQWVEDYLGENLALFWGEMWKRANSASVQNRYRFSGYHSTPYGAGWFFMPLRTKQMLISYIQQSALIADLSQHILWLDCSTSPSK